MKTTKDTMRIKDIADLKFKEHLETINYYISEGINKPKAFCIVMDDSTLGAGYKAQMRKEVGLGMFD